MFVHSYMGFKYSYPILIFINQIYLTHRWDPNNYQSGPGSNSSEGSTSHFPDLQNYSLTTRYNLMLYSGYSKIRIVSTCYTCTQIKISIFFQSVPILFSVSTHILFSSVCVCVCVCVCVWFSLFNGYTG